MERMTDTISLSLTKRLSEFSFPPITVYHFNAEMDQVFKEHLVEWINSQVFTNTINVSEAIRNFQKKYKITEGEYPFDNMYRHYTRWNNDEYHQKRISA